MKEQVRLEVTRALPDGSHLEAPVAAFDIDVEKSEQGERAVSAQQICEVVQQVTGRPLLFYDPGFMNTAAATSRITYVDGENGVLLYRGYPIEQLAARSSFLEVAYLLVFGELPTREQLREWSDEVMRHAFVHEALLVYERKFRYNAHPMGVLVATLASMSTYHPDANPSLHAENIFDHPAAHPDHDGKLLTHVAKIVGQIPTLASLAYRHRIGRPYNYPMPSLYADEQDDDTGRASGTGSRSKIYEQDERKKYDYTRNFLYMLDRLSEPDYQPNEELVRALDVLFIVHADHEFNCSTSTVRHLASVRVDPYSACAGGAAALYGPLHGGASEGVVRMLHRIGAKENVRSFLDRVMAKEELLVGFGHRIYKNYDPRARVLKEHAHKVFELMKSSASASSRGSVEDGMGSSGCSSDGTQQHTASTEVLIDIAEELERCALEMPYFVSRMLYPNVDFYSGVIYTAMGFPLDMFPVLFAIPRAVGWLAHYREVIQDDNLSNTRSICRPSVLYDGDDAGTASPQKAPEVDHSLLSSRRLLSRRLSSLP
ncbi:Citrate synthase, peroxisomal [Porphyridium purpureum]|uniref:Citrate synthase n=1 Tax=Porphyridium purpureum TaxID=35688 RepID=A0A5J4YJI3_PORPP|nr:Citrate synthase, peroxisomal [Porphyridium purpureum]|eukprot:POR0034..scf289_17